MKSRNNEKVQSAIIPHVYIFSLLILLCQYLNLSDKDRNQPTTVLIEIPADKFNQHRRLSNYPINSPYPITLGPPSLLSRYRS